MLNNNKTYENSNLRDVQITFNDGICTIFKAIERKLIENIGNFDFSNGSVGVGHYFQAYNNNISIDRIIRIPLNDKIDPQDVAQIGEEFYRIVRIQYKDDKRPKYMSLSLQRSAFQYINAVPEEENDG